jgi:hypothetical protein
MVSSLAEGTVTEEQINPRAVKIGELLIGVGALTSGDLTEAIQIAKRMGVPIGRVLVMSGCVSEPKLQQALELQSLVKDGLCDLDVGMKALLKVFKENKELKSALKELNWAPKQDANSNKLGELLIDSNIVTRGQLDRALETSFQSGMPLGGTLVIQGVLSAQLLPTILHTQEQIRDQKMSREEALNSLQQALMFWAKADQSKDNHEIGSQPKSPSKSEQTIPPPAIVPQPQQSSAPAGPKSIGAKGAPIPRAEQRGSQSATSPSATSDGASPPAIPAKAGMIDTADVANIAAAAAGSSSMQKLQSRAQHELEEANSVSLIELLHLTGYCTQASLEEALTEALTDSRLAAKMLVAIGFIDSGMLNKYVYCQALIAKGVLRTDQAMYILNAIRHRNLTLEQALGELGIPASVIP